MDMEIQLLYESLSKKDFKLFLEHIQRMGSGEAPLFATTLSLVYDKLVEKAFVRHIPPGSRVGKSAEVQSITNSCTPLQASTSISSVPSTSGPGPSKSAEVPPVSNPWLPLRARDPISPPQLMWLQCYRCSKFALSKDLCDGLHCPKCLSNSGE